MPLNYKLLEKFGTHEERLKEIFTAAPERLPSDAPEDLKKSVKEDYRVRQKIEELIQNRIDEAILQTLNTSHLYAAVDLAWDSSTITRRTIPLVLYAQKRIDMEKCVTQLKDLKCADQFVRLDERGKPKSLDLPKFTEVNINLLRSIISRRVAAQSARFTNLYPFFKFEPRGTSEADKLRADILSQRIDIMADQYGYRSVQVQWIRDMLLYPYVVAFPAAKWDREIEWYDENEDKAEEFQDAESKPKSRVKREGVPLITPHPSRVFYDIAHPIHSINSDSGCEWFGFWDIFRYSQILDNPTYYNRQDITYSPDASSWFQSYSSYFSQYYTKISPPVNQESIASQNDRKSQMDRYTSQMRDSSVYVTHLYWKIRPNEWRMGDYPHPVWLHLVIANSKNVIAAEIMPDCPGFVFSFNTSQQRLVNLSMAHELLPFQDQLSNLFSQLLECAKRDLFGIAMLNLDAFPVENETAKKALDSFREAMRNENFFAQTSILEVSVTKMRELGVDLDSVFKIIRQPPNTNLNTIINSIGQTIMMAERVMALSPQEQGQQSPRETSATEVQIIAGTTENIYQFISDAVDEGRSAVKRYLYNALISLGTEDIYLPVVNRYRRDVAEKAGFKIADDESAGMMPGPNPVQFSVIGTKKNLVAEYIFNSRDGAERASNIQGAQTLTQMLGVLMQPAVLSMLTKEKLADIINTIIRQSGAGVDVIVEPPPGEGAFPVMAAQQAAPTSIPSETLQSQFPTS
jgi:hypothetical protein